MNPEIQNILAALRLANENGLDEQFISGANTLYPYLEAKGLLVEADHLLTQAIAASEDQTLTLLNAGRAAQRLGKVEQAEQHFQAAAKFEDDVAAVCAALLTNLGILEVSLGQLQEAEARFVEALGLARAEKDRSLLGPILTNLGVIAARNRTFETCKRLFR